MVYIMMLFFCSDKLLKLLSLLQTYSITKN